MSVKTNKKISSYESIINAIGVFSFLHFFKLLSGIITTKFAAIYLGPFGVGILGLIKNSLSLISSITNFGFSETGLREVAKTNIASNKTETNITIQLVTSLSSYLGVLGGLLTIVLCMPLSFWIFETYDKFYWFVLLLSLIHI